MYLLLPSTAIPKKIIPLPKFIIKAQVHPITIDKIKNCIERLLIYDLSRTSSFFFSSSSFFFSSSSFSSWAGSRRYWVSRNRCCWISFRSGLWFVKFQKMPPFVAGNSPLVSLDSNGIWTILMNCDNWWKRDPLSIPMHSH